MPVEGRTPASDVLATELKVQGIGDEPHNPRKDRDAPAQALCEGPFFLKQEWAEPGFRFYRLYDKVYRAGILAHAWSLAKANDGAPGVDGVTFDKIEAGGLAEWLAALAEELQELPYRPQAVRRVMIPKAGGGERPRPCGAWLRHDAFRRSRIVWCRRPPSWCWSQSSRPASTPRRMATGPAAVPWTPSNACTAASEPDARMWLTRICRSTSTRSRTTSSYNA